jgi:hypothetical protein
VLLALVSLTVILVHIALVPRKRKSGLEFWVIKFPDSLMELLTSAIVVVQVERVAIMVYNFVRARYWQCKHCYSSSNSISHVLRDESQHCLINIIFWAFHERRAVCPMKILKFAIFDLILQLGIME